jgi:hypothetical protein
MIINILINGNRNLENKDDPTPAFISVDRLTMYYRSFFYQLFILRTERPWQSD